MSAHSFGPWKVSDGAVVSRSGVTILLPSLGTYNFSQITPNLNLAAASPQLVKALDPGPLGMGYQLELAARVLAGEIPMESVDCAALAVYLREQLAVRHEALAAAGAES